MPPTPIFTGTVTAQRTLVLNSPLAFRAHLDQFKEKPVEVVVRLVKSKRSLDQNAWIWGVAYPILAETLGYDYEERESLHYALVAKCFGTNYDERLKADVPRKRSSKLSTKEFSEYMEWLVRFAAKEFACIIPLPEEIEYEHATV